MLNFYHLKIARFLYACYHPKITGPILKVCKKKKKNETKKPNKGQGSQRRRGGGRGSWPFCCGPSTFTKLYFCHSGFHGKLLVCYCQRHPRYCWLLHFHSHVWGPEGVCFSKIISLVIMEMKNESHRYDMNRLTSDHGHKYTIYRQCMMLCMMLICNK